MDDRINNSGQRNYGLDIVRCMAVSMVLISHSLLDIYSKKIPFLWYGTFIGVELFFSLSGFLIGQLLLDMFNRHAADISFKHIARFWIRRWFRTLPLFYILYFVFLFVYKEWVFPVQGNWHSLLFLQNIASPPDCFYGESWSLSIEEWFYLVIPLLLYLAYSAFYRKPGKTVRINIIFIWIVVLVIITQIIFRRICPDCTPWGCIAVLFRFDAIAYGLAGAYAASRISGMNRKKTIGMLGAGTILCMMAAIIKFKLYDQGYLAQIYYPVNGIGTVLLVMGLYYYRFGKQYAVIGFISKISYSIYLTHLTGIIIPLLWWTRNTALSGTLLLWLLALLIVFITSCLTYRFIEKPFMKLGEKWFPAMSPQPGTTKMTEIFQDRKGDKIVIEGNYQFNAYYFGRKPQRFWHYTKMQEAQNELALKEGDKILDAGCGSGLLSYFLAKDNPIEVWGIDGNPSAIDFCRAKFPLENLHFSQTLMDELPFSNSSFNKIVFLEVIEHISPSQGAKVLGTFYDLLAPGGTLVISTPNKRSLWPLIEYLLDKFKLVPTLAKEQHEYLYTCKQLKKMAELAGFRCISQRTINFISPWVAGISWKLALKIHNMEIKGKSKFGALLLFTFKKPEH